MLLMTAIEILSIFKTIFNTTTQVATFYKDI